MILLAAATVVFAAGVGFFILGDVVRRQASARAEHAIVTANREALAVIQAERVRADAREAELQNQLMYLAGRTWGPPPEPPRAEQPAPTPPPRLRDASYFPDAAELDAVPYVEV